MARNLDNLANIMEVKLLKIKAATLDAKKQVATTALKTLIDRTPVDTSTALSNWQVSTGSPATNFINAYVPGYLGYTAQASGSEALRVGIANMATVQPGQSIFVSNNAPYISDLNSGTSRQAPAGFVEAAILVARLTPIKFDI